MSRAALAYAERLGWAVLPLWAPRGDGSCRCDKPGCESPGKHPIGALVPHGVKDATTVSARIRSWWSRCPDANVGIACGSGLFVLDVDGAEGAMQLRVLVEEHGDLPATPIQQTGNGRQIVFRPGSTPLGNKVKFLRGLDTRANGGLFVAPPSVHYSGRRYAWEVSPLDVVPALLPAWLEQLVIDRNGSESRSTADPLPTVIPDGQRNKWLTSLAGTMRRRGASPQSIEAALRVENQLRCRPPLGDAEVRSISASVARYAPQDGGTYGSQA